MAEGPKSGDSNATPPSGHLSVRVEGPASFEPYFLVGQQSKRLGPALLTSFLLDVGLAVLLVFATRYGPPTKNIRSILPDIPNDQIVWLAQPGPGGGGGGGGNKMKEPPRQAQLPGKDKITVPVEKPPALELEKPPEKEPDPVEQLNIPAKTLASSTESLPGAIDAPQAPVVASLGSGSGGGAGTGSGSGIGSGTGSGLGEGSGGGTGGGVYRPGNGVTTPRLLRQVKPAYTSDAMRAKVQGTVLLQCTVQADGTVADIRILRSLDPVFGLDQEAVKAARQWQFAPGTRMGEPVKVEITIELSFSLR